MKINNQEVITKIHLVISSVVVLVVSIIYGFNIESQIKIEPNTIDEFNFFKAVMGIYIGFSILWILGVFKPEFLKLALWSNMIFMLGLGFGRVISLLVDGLPSLAYIYGTAGELVLGFYGIWVLTGKKH
ncbi:DUF4345 domain-containing protein [Seonamhaeicola marinus]|uniref:DUF4345 domain-containing protein n=1 Tax=Seonamhaeicola marinus TaxID=1912246 RepID=A0A5D0HTH2_9FLAO|nr:DUF4345 domain-containing protein [Seonamhaeicola marinus]TYA74220.1 DUF4345 domain-containing protein [Seonamhaeicola marinus]